MKPRSLPYAIVGAMLAFAASAVSAPAVEAQTLSGQPIRVISPFAAGSVSDITLRILAERAGTGLKTQIIVENMPGAGGITAARAVKNASADGHTLALLSNATAVTMATFKNPGFNPSDDFVPISGMSDFAYLLLVNDKAKYKSLQDFLAAARANPGKLNVGTAAPGTTPYLTALILKKAAGVDFTIVPFHGASDLTIALLRNDIDLVINAYGAVRQSIGTDRLRPIATTTSKRSAFLPHVPTVQEAGLKDFEVSSWNGIFAPAHTPPGIVDRLAVEIQKSLAEPDVVAKFRKLGVEVWPGQAKELSARMHSETERWNKVVDEAGIPRH